MAKVKEEINEEQITAEREQRDLEAKLKSAVIIALGRPPHYHGIGVHSLFLDAYRVNVLTEDDGQKRIVDSFFLHFNVKEGIITSTPPIKMKYVEKKESPVPN